MSPFFVSPISDLKTHLINFPGAQKKRESYLLESSYHAQSEKQNRLFKSSPSDVPDAEKVDNLQGSLEEFNKRLHLRSSQKKRVAEIKSGTLSASEISRS